jgi:two-component system sensor histidine kinase/response regulator
VWYSSARAGSELNENSIYESVVGIAGGGMSTNTLENKNTEGRSLAIQPSNKLKHSRQSLEREIMELKNHNSELTELVHIIAHEIKNPLSSMIGFASLIDQYHAQMNIEDIRENARTTIEIGHQMKGIIDGLLLLAKIDSEIDAEMTPLDMKLIMEEVTQSLSSVIRDYSANIYFPQEWPLARGYTPWVKQVWTNYISNAIKYGGSPPVIQISAEATNGYVHFWIQDNGRGLSAEEQQQLFRPFVRLRKHEAEGNGLGLRIVKKIMERLEGKILLDSEIGKGSRFGFTLPTA